MENDWLTIFDTHGNAGDNTISYSLEPNNTNSSCTAYIIILCEDEHLSIKITQSNEEDPNNDELDNLDSRSLYMRNMINIFPESILIDYDGNLFSYNSDDLVKRIKGNLIWNISWDYHTIEISTVYMSDQTAGHHIE